MSKHFSKLIEMCEEIMRTPEQYIQSFSQVSMA